MDLLETEEEREAKTAAFVKEMTALINQEVEAIEVKMRHCSKDTDKAIYSQHIKNYKGIKAQLNPADGSQSKLLKTSCKSGWEQTIQTVIGNLCFNRSYNKTIVQCGSNRA